MDNLNFELIDTKEAMRLLGYKDRSSFTRARIQMDIPCYRINSRRVMFDKLELAQWLERRREGRRYL